MEANGSPSHISTKIQLFILDYLDRAQILKMLISNPPAPPYAASTPHGAFAGSACFCSKLFKCLKAIRNPLTKPEGPN
jgi:hypothetical protein